MPLADQGLEGLSGVVEIRGSAAEFFGFGRSFVGGASHLGGCVLDIGEGLTEAIHADRLSLAG